MPTKQTHQRGFVSIFTVIMFSILMSILIVGFVRLMVDEQQQTLEDDLSKSAYNSAQAGIEDAKRAMLYCQTQTGFAKISCDDALYGTGSQTCPGFNRTARFFGDLGIPQAQSFQTQVGDPQANQGYSCVIITRDTPTLTGKVEPGTENDARMYELTTDGPFDWVQIDWDKGGIVGDLRSESDYTTNSNPRTTDWEDGPGVMRATILSVPVGAVNIHGNTSLKTVFLYPTDTSTTASYDIVSSAGSRVTTSCTSPVDGYTCSARLTGFDTAAYRYFLVLRPVYKAADYRVTAGPTAGSPVTFMNVSPSIDATGYADNIYRRVTARVQTGSVVEALNSLDLGTGICKDFLMSVGTAIEDICSPFPPPPIAPCFRPHDVALVLYISSSMDESWQNMSKMAKMKSVAKDFASNTGLGPAANRVAVIGFWDSAQTYLPFSSNETAILNSIDNLPSSYSGTSYRHGLQYATALIGNPILTRPSPVQKVVIFISDGDPNPGQSDAEITGLTNTLKNTYNTVIYTIGIKAMSPEARTTLSLMASSPSTYTTAETQDSFDEFFADIKADIDC